MEDTQNTENTEQVSTSVAPIENSNGVSFPTVGQPNKSNGAKTLLIVGILVLVAILGFVIYKSASKKESSVNATPTSFDNLTTPTDQTVQTFTPVPSVAPVTKVDKSKVKIQVQNGTGIAGEAGYLQTQLGKLGYTNIKVGNSSTTGTAASVTFSSSLDSGVVSEITQELNSIYQTVNTQTSPTATFDIVIVTGLKKGATPKPVETATPVDTSSPTASPTSSPTASPTATPVGQ